MSKYIYNIIKSLIVSLLHEVVVGGRWVSLQAKTKATKVISSGKGPDHPASRKPKTPQKYSSGMVLSFKNVYRYWLGNTSRPLNTINPLCCSPGVCPPRGRGWLPVRQSTDRL